MNAADQSAEQFREGQAAYAAGVPVNWHASGDWLDGWKSARREAQIDAHLEQEASDGDQRATN